MRYSRVGWRATEEGVFGEVKWWPSVTCHFQSYGKNRNAHHEKQFRASKSYIKSIEFEIHDVAATGTLKGDRIDLVVPTP